MACSKFLIFSDGACSGNPGPGGWGCVVASEDGSVTELGGGDDQTTNNRMELYASIAALKFIKDQPGTVDFYTDSVYVIRGITQWIWGWQKKNWTTSEGQPVINKDLWQQLYFLAIARKPAIRWLYSRGHIGTPGNERCDQIAVAFSKHKYIELYNGPLLKYFVPIYDVPENSDLPEMKSPPGKAGDKNKPKPYSYLSYVSGSVVRHKSWSSCEKQVKGRSGAKFKKAMSALDETQILIDWGLSKNTKVTDSDQ